MATDLDWDQICSSAPEDWSVRTLGSYFTERTSKGHEDLPLLSVTGEGLCPQSETNRRDTSNEDKSTYKRVVPGDIAYNTMRMWQGRSVVVDREGLVSPAYTVVTPKTGLDLGFAGHLLRFPPLVRKFRAHSQGLVSDTWNLKFTAFARITAPLPPLPEQKKIAAILSSVDETIQATQAVIEQTRRVKEGLLQELLTRGIGHTRFKQTPIGEIPEDWEVRPLHELCTWVGVGIASSATHAYCEQGVPMVRNQNIRPGRIDLTDLLHVTPEYDLENRTKRIRTGDVLTIRTGYPGVSAVVPPQLDKAQSFTTLVSRPRAEFLNPGFLAEWINSEMGRSFVLAGQAGGAQQNLNAGTLRNLPVPLPPRQEQDRIVELAQCVADSKHQEQDLEHRLWSLKTALLHDLLTGTVRVTP